MTERCDPDDATLRIEAQYAIRKSNTHICLCAHCRAQSKNAKVRHTDSCCFGRERIKRRVLPHNIEIVEWLPRGSSLRA